MTMSAVGLPDPGKQLFTMKNFLMVVGLLGAASWGLLMWNVKGAVDDIHMAVGTANAAMTKATINGDAIERISNTESRIANLVVDHETRLSIMEEKTHTQRRPSMHMFGGVGP